MRALSLWEPHASLIALGHKTIETRTWRTHVRGPLLICAAKRNCKEVRETIRFFQNPEWCLTELCREEPLLPPDFKPALGMAVAVCQIVGCESLQHTDFYAACVPEPTHLIGFYLEDVQAIEPFPVRGAQGFFETEVPAEIEALVEKGDVDGSQRTLPGIRG